MTQNKLIVSNWKMNLNISDSRKLINKLVKSTQKIKSRIKIIICPQFLLIPQVSNMIKNTQIILGSQDCHYEKSGAFTGETSIELLKSFKCKYVILGHSERREHNDESNLIISKKIKITHKFNLKPIICIGESIDLRKKGKYLSFLESQLNECVPNVKEIIIAYEPIWSIGTGLIPSSQEILEVNNFVKKYLWKKKKLKKLAFCMGDLFHLKT